MALREVEHIANRADMKHSAIALLQNRIVPTLLAEALDSHISSRLAPSMIALEGLHAALFTRDNTIPRAAPAIMDHDQTTLKTVQFNVEAAAHTLLAAHWMGLHGDAFSKIGQDTVAVYQFADAVGTLLPAPCSPSPPAAS